MSEPWPREHPQQESNLQPTYFESVPNKPGIRVNAQRTRTTLTASSRKIPGDHGWTCSKRVQLSCARHV